MRIACSTSFHRGNLDEALGLIAGMGFDHVDLICIDGWDLIKLSDLVADFDSRFAEIESLLQKHGLTPLSTNSGFAATYQRDDETSNQQRLTEVRALAQMMQKLGIPRGGYYPGYKVDPAHRSWDDAFDASLKTIDEVNQIAAEHLIRLGPELHFNTIYENMDEGRRLFEARPQQTIVYDPTHFIYQDIPVEQTLPFLKQAHHVHLRGARPQEIQAPADDDTLSFFPWVIQQLKEMNYQGDCSIEYLPKAEFDVRQSIMRTRERITELWAS